MEWLYLGLASAAEITWATAMKYADGFTRLLPSLITIGGYIVSAVFLSLAMRKLPLGTAYAIWTGVGIIGTSVLGAALFHETLDVPQILCVVMIGAGIAGLKLL